MLSRTLPRTALRYGARSATTESRQVSQGADVDSYCGFLACFLHHLLLADYFPQWAEALNKPLTETDPEIDDIMEHEKLRQRKSIVLIASEVSTRAGV